MPGGAGAIALDERGGNVWGWERRLTGTCSGCPPEAVIELRVNGVAASAERIGETFGGTVRLAPGANEVAAVAVLPDGREERSAPVRYTVPLTPRPIARLAIAVADGHMTLDATASEPSDHDGAAIRTWSIAPRAGNPAPLDLIEAAPGVWSGPAPLVDGEYYVDLKVADDRGRTDTATTRLVVESGQARVPDPDHKRAGWIDRAVVYGVVPRNFDPPGFAGVSARLDDLRDLGITALWLAPITRTIPGLFGYEVTDYFEVRPEYGTQADFRDLVSAAHARGIRVLLDFVPNHTSAEHPYFQDTEAHGPASRYWDFFDRDAGGKPSHYFDWSHLPNLNFANPEVGRFMLEAFSYWVREFDVDGFRIDAVWGIKQRNPEWPAALLAELNRIKPDTLLIAEASARDPWYFEQGFDAAYDWTGELGHWAWADAFGGQAPIGQAMVEALTGEGRGYHEDALVMRILNNNDTGPRFVTVHGVDCYRVALAMLLTLPGLPCLFTGDEVGAEFQPYDTTGPIDWTDHAGLRADTKRLIALRRDLPALRSRAWLPLPAPPLFSYLRTAPGAAPVVVVLNFSATAVTAKIGLPAAGLTDGTLVDRWTGEAVAAPVDGVLPVTIADWGFRVVTHGDA